MIKSGEAPEKTDLRATHVQLSIHAFILSELLWVSPLMIEVYGVSPLLNKAKETGGSLNQALEHHDAAASP